MEAKDYKGHKWVKAQWRAHRGEGESLKAWAARQHDGSDAHQWLLNKRNK
jgi:hypothetical protein